MDGAASEEELSLGWLAVGEGWVVGDGFVKAVIVLTALGDGEEGVVIVGGTLPLIALVRIDRRHAEVVPIDHVFDLRGEVEESKALTIALPPLGKDIVTVFACDIYVRWNPGLL